MRVVGDDADGFAVEPRKADRRRLAETGLELEKAAAIDDQFDDPFHVRLGTSALGTPGFSPEPSGPAPQVTIRHYGSACRTEIPDRCHGLLVGVDELIDQAGLFGVKAPAAQFLEIDLFTDRHGNKTRT